MATAIVTFYPLIRDRVLRTKDYDCKFLPDKNPEFVIAMAFVGHHVPCVVIVVCYAIVYYEIRRLVKNRPQDRHKNSPPSRRKVATSKVTPSAYVVDDNKTIAGIGEENGTENGLTTAETSLNGKEHTKTAGTKDVKPGVAEEDIVVENNHGKKSQAQGTSKVQPGDHEAQAANEKQKADHKAVNKRRKTFITLSYIVLAYMVCWVCALGQLEPQRQTMYGLLGTIPLRLRCESGEPDDRSRRPVHGGILDDLCQLRAEPVYVRLQFGRFPQSCHPDDQMPLLQIADVAGCVLL